MSKVSDYLERMYGGRTAWRQSTVEVAATTTQIAGERPDRVMLQVQNLGEYPVYVGTYPGFDDSEAFYVAEGGGVLIMKAQDDGELTCAALWGRSSVSSPMTVMVYEVWVQ